MSTHNIGLGRELLDLKCHRFLLSGALHADELSHTTEKISVHGEEYVSKYYRILT